MGRTSTKQGSSEQTASRLPGRMTIVEALFSSTQRRVLGILFGEPGRSFFATEIIDRVSKGSGAVQRELKKLSESGLVTVSRIGNQKHYQANPESPVYSELCSLVRKTIGLADPLRNALAGVEQDLLLALVYGSVARGEETATSDVDLLLVSDTLTLEDTYRLLAAAEEALGRRINPTLYTAPEFEQRLRDGAPFLKRVLDGETIVLMGKLPRE